jgi:hypothetical protein
MNLLSLVRPDYFQTLRFQLRWKTGKAQKKLAFSLLKQAILHEKLFEYQFLF